MKTMRVRAGISTLVFCIAISQSVKADDCKDYYMHTSEVVKEIKLSTDDPCANVHARGWCCNDEISDIDIIEEAKQIIIERGIRWPRIGRDEAEPEKRTDKWYIAQGIARRTLGGGIFLSNINPGPGQTITTTLKGSRKFGELVRLVERAINQVQGEER